MKRASTFNEDKTVLSLAFDPSGAVLASGNEDQTVKLWDTASGKLLRTLSGHEERVWSVAFHPKGKILASAAADKTVRLWEVPGGTQLKILQHTAAVYTVAWHPDGKVLASAGDDGTINVWDVSTGELFYRTSERHDYGTMSVAFDPVGGLLASAGVDKTVRLWDSSSGRSLRSLVGHEAAVTAVVFDSRGQLLASAGNDSTIKLWDPHSGVLLRTLEGHTHNVSTVAFSSGGLFASRSKDNTIRLWNCDTWETVAIIPHKTPSDWWIPALAFHPGLPLLAAGTFSSVALLELGLETLLGHGTLVPAEARAVHHTTAKIVLLGDHSVGKSALGFRLIHGRFEKQESTHGQQFWLFPALGQRRSDQTDCEAILWDFAGQPDYRLVHALFVDNADLALVLFDASDIRDPLHGVGFWLRQLRAGQSRCPVLLVAAQTDRGTCSMTPDELRAFCQTQGIQGPVVTSAVTGLGLDELIERMRSLIRWEEKAATVTTATFKRIKDYVLGLKEQKSDSRIIVSLEELRKRLVATDAEWDFSDAEMLTAVGHLENYGYVKRLRTSRGEQRVLLQPELLNNLASSFVLQARRNEKGLGSLEEKRLLNGGYDFPELSNLDVKEREVLLDSAVVLFLEHNICFRETDPLRMEPYLVFPELINLKKPLEEEKATEDGTAYTLDGPTENVFASLVVLLGYTHTFTRTAQWHNNARYEVGDGIACGFRQEAERDGELDLVLCFGPNAGLPVRNLFQGLFESFLARRNLTVTRYDVVRCTNTKCGHLLDRSVVRQRVNEGKLFAFCNDCGEKLTLPAQAEPIQLTRETRSEVERQRHVAERRTRFEEAVFRVRAYISDQKITPPETFISYAWGIPEHERWVEKRLATDLQNAGISVVLDRWHNAQIGASVGRFVERIENSDRIVMIGTPLYRRKYENKDTSTGYVVAAEVDLIHNRLLGTESQKQSVLPVLLEGEKTASLPPLLHGRVYGDFRDELAYFTTAFDLILSLYQIATTDPVVADLRDALREPRMR